MEEDHNNKDGEGSAILNTRLYKEKCPYYPINKKQSLKQGW